MTRMRYFFRQALLHVRRSPFVASVTVATVAVVFLLLGVFALLGYNLALLANRLGSGLQMSVFLKDDTAEDQRRAIQELLGSSALVAKVEFVDPAEALRRFRERLGTQASLLEGLGVGLLPASFEVTLSSAANDSAALRALAAQLVNTPGVEELQYGQAWLDEFFKFLDLGRVVALVVAALIVFATLVIVSNTIRLSVFARQEEILILKLVGASDAFVKVPFYIEGVVLGTLGSALGTVVLWGLFLLLEPGLLVPAGFGRGGLTVEFLPQAGVVAMVSGGAVLGLLGTVMSLWRNLKI